MDYTVDDVVLAADNHNIAAGSLSFLSDTKNFLVGAVVSGAHSFYNTGIDVGNWVAGDDRFERADTYDTLQRMDSNLGAYYEEHKEGVDLGGMVLGSIIPGMAVTKAVNYGSRALMAANAGRFGLNISSATGIAPTLSEAFYAKAAAQLAEGTVASRFNMSTIAGLVAGMGEQTLMVAGTELAVAATMEASPVIEQMTWKDHMYNTAVGAAFFAPIFTGIGAVKGLKAASKAATAADIEANAFRTIPADIPTLDDAQNLFFLYERQKNFVAPALVEGMSDARFSQLNKYADETMRAMDLKIRTRWMALTGGDQQLTDILRDINNVASLDDVAGNIALLKEIRRGSEVLSVDKKGLAQMWDEFAQKKVQSVYRTKNGQLFMNEADAIMHSDLDATVGIKAQEYVGLKVLDQNTPKGAKITELDGYDAVIKPGERHLTLVQGIDSKAKELLISDFKGDYSKKFLHLQGEFAGRTLDEAPAVLRLADTVKPGEKISFEYRRGKPIVYAGKDQYTLPAVGEKVDLAKDTLQNVQARYIYAGERQALGVGSTIHEGDIPFLEKAYFQGLREFNILDDAGNTYKAPVGEDLLRFIEYKKGELAAQIKGISAEVSERINVPVQYLEGRKISDNPIENLFMLQNQNYPGYVAYQHPSYAQLGYDTSAIELLGNTVEATTSNEQLRKLALQYNEQVAAKFFGDTYKSFPTFGPDDILNTSRYSGGQGFASFGQGEYFTPQGRVSAEIKTELIGRLTANMQEKAATVVNDTFASIGVKAANNPAAAIEYSMLQNFGRSTGDSYVLRGGKMILKSKLLFDEETASLMTAAKTTEAKEAIRLSRKYIPPAGKEVPVEVTLKHPETVELIISHNERNAAWVAAENGRRTAQGLNTISLMDGEFYAPQHNFRDYPHFALVRDKVTNEMSFIGAYKADVLQDLAAKIPGSHQVLYKANTAEWFKALGEFEYSRTITENSTDAMLKRNGILSDFFPKTDANMIVSDLVNWHKEQAIAQVRNMVKVKYAEPIAMLNDLSKQATAAYSSTVKSGKVFAESVADPYDDMIKTMLNVSKASRSKVWTGSQKIMDEWVSEAFSKFQRTMAEAKGVADLDGINTMLAESGYRGPLYGVDTVLAVNHTAPKGVLSEAVRRCNSLATNLMLRLDSVQAINNAVSTNILAGSEMQYLLSRIQNNPEMAAQWDELAKIAVPGAEGVTLNSSAKLVARQYSKFFGDLITPEKALIGKYKDLGLIKLPAEALAENMEHMARSIQFPQEATGRLGKVLDSMRGLGSKAMEEGEFWTGNKHSEMMGRFVAAGIADDITSILVKGGAMSETDALAVINSFVNKVHGSTLASQRPILFQGAVGQAISLFQTYQFNLMQQLLKYVGDGQSKAAATLLGMQTAIYGVQGIPAFSALNTHVIGNASGNLEHRDVYSEVSNVVGKEAGEWLMYGLAANALNSNIYTRGDLNPRQATVIPTSLADVPFISMSAKFVANAYSSLESVAKGAPAGAAFLQGLEHAGVNRPLSGLAAVIQGYTTTGSGSLISRTRTHDDISGGTDWYLLNNLGRIAGSKPLDEAILLEANYRYAAYKSADLDRLKSLGKAVKTKILAGSPLEGDEMTQLMMDYQRAGGRQETFSKQMMKWYKDANRSTINQIAEQLNSDRGRYLQRVMAGSQGMPE